MTAADLADLNGLLAKLAAVSAERGDTRPKERIVDHILRDYDAPDINPLLNRLALTLGRATLALMLIAAICAPPPPSDNGCHLGPPFTYCDAASAGLGE